MNRGQPGRERVGTREAGALLAGKFRGIELANGEPALELVRTFSGFAVGVDGGTLLALSPTGVVCVALNRYTTVPEEKAESGARPSAMRSDQGGYEA